MASQALAAGSAVEAKTGAGCVGWTSVPGRVVSSMQSIRPLFKGISGSMVDTSDPTMAALVQAREQLTGPMTWACVSLKSAETFSFVLEIVTRIGNGPPPLPSSSMTSSPLAVPSGICSSPARNRRRE